jgi:hypothetical protein
MAQLSYAATSNYGLQVTTKDAGKLLKHSPEGKEMSAKVTGTA